MERLDFVYFWVKGEQGSEELRHSMRSLAKNLAGYDLRVHLIGDRPDWVSDEVNVIEVPRVTPQDAPISYPTFDTNRKMKIVCKCKDISDEFWQIDDDMWMLKPMTPGKLRAEIVEQGPLNRPDQIFGMWASGSQYEFMMLKALTLSALWRRGVRVLYDYCTHLPNWYHKANMSHIMDSYDVEYQPLLFSLLYGNTFYDHKRVLWCNAPGSDVRHRSGFFEGYDWLVKTLQTKYWFNMCADAHCAESMILLERMFPEQCRFEREGVRRWQSSDGTVVREQLTLSQAKETGQAELSLQAVQ